jgi:hypothetical protein
MIFIKKLILTTLSTALLTTPALAIGQFIVEDAAGEVEIYSDVQITQTADTLSLTASDSDITLVINKKNCNMEKAIQVCSAGDVIISTHGVDETLEVEQVYVFINPSNERQMLEGSEVILSPNTVLVEILTAKGTYINGMGKIDATAKP